MMNTSVHSIIKKGLKKQKKVFLFFIKSNTNASFNEDNDINIELYDIIKL